MSTKSKIEKVKSIINSCVTYEQIQSCFSFVKGNFFTNEFERWEILSFLQNKAYALRNEDLTFHNQELKSILR